MAVPYTFGTATAAIPLSQLDSNFATPVTIGNTAVQLGNTVTSFGNVTLTNVTISSGNVTITGANVSGTANVSTLVVTSNETVLGNTAVTGNITASLFTSLSTFGFKNRIINGAMVISQRNGTSSVNVPGTSYPYQMDRFYCGGLNGVATPFTLQQVSDAPTNFVNSVKITVANTDSLSNAATEYGIQQTIEANNVNDFNLGSANAVSVTLSFWVKSSLTGTFGLGVRNSPTFNRSYVATYTINSANTWEQKTVSFTMDTTGTWSTSGTGAAINISWSLGCGTNFNGTANTWNASGANQTSGSVKLVSNSAATWQITGVQFEKGSTATSFDYRPYGTELMLCQRYYETSNGAGGKETNTDAFVVTTTSLTNFPAFTYKVGKRSTTSLVATIAGGTGATFVVGQSSFYQNAANSAASTFGWNASSEL